MTRIFKKHEDLYIFANIIELFFVRKIKCFLVFFIYRSARIKYMQMFEYAIYIILKCFSKRFINDGNSCCNMHHVPKVKPPPPPPHNTVCLFFFILLNFKKATILHNYLIYLYSRIASMYFKQILICY